jgi:hypothetical protein
MFLILKVTGVQRFMHAHKQCLFIRNGVALKRAVGFLALKRAVWSFFYRGPWNRQNGQLGCGSNCIHTRQSRHAGRTPHRRHFTNEWTSELVHMGQVNWMSSPKTAHLGTSWSGLPAAASTWLDVGGWVLLLLLRCLIGPGASVGTTWSPEGPAAGGGGPAAGGSGGRGCAAGCLWRRSLLANVARSMCEIVTHWPLICSSTATNSRNRRRGKTIKSYVEKSCSIFFRLVVAFAG